MEDLKRAVKKICSHSCVDFYQLKVPVIKIAFLRAIEDLTDTNYLKYINKNEIKVEELNLYVKNIEKINAMNIDEFKESDIDFLKIAIEEFRNINFGYNSISFYEDTLTYIYSVMTDYFFDGSAHKCFAEYITPKPVCNLISKILNAKEFKYNDSVCDPCCGTGALIIPVLRDNYDKNLRVFAQDVNRESVQICKMNIFLQQTKNLIRQLKEVNGFSKDVI